MIKIFTVFLIAIIIKIDKKIKLTVRSAHSLPFIHISNFIFIIIYATAYDAALMMMMANCKPVLFTLILFFSAHS